MNRKLCVAFAFAAAISIKLPYESGQRFVVVQGYDSPPTHINKDLYAIDFSQDGCDAYGKLAVAANDGTVLLAQESGYNGGYGTQILVVNANRIIARYAHMIPGSIPASIATTGATVVQGEPLGEIGNTGLVEGAACPTHPGTHIHFAMYTENSDGSFSPFRPEPISNYVGITEENWYLSDNAIAITTLPGATAVVDRAAQTIFETGGVSASTPTAPTPTSTPPASFSTPAATTTPAVPLSATATFNSSTLAIDLSWPATQNATATTTATTTPSSSNTIYQIFSLGSSVTASSSSPTSTFVATTTVPYFSYPLSDSDFNLSLQFEIIFGGGDASAGGSTITTIPVSLPNWWTIIQPIEDTNSNGSWYDDNWYDLGTGFYGDIRELTLEGFIDNSAYRASHLYIEEYLDSNYSELNQIYTISDDAPFTDGMKKVTIGSLNIPLQPNKYYRLATLQDYQNRSIILAGTSATGTAMWDAYIYGVGGVQYQYQFYPYLAAVIIPDYPPLQPPTAPANATTSFDSLNSILTVSWAGATDPDTTSSLLTYQVNVSTSTSFDPAQWQPLGKTFSTTTPVVFGNSYTIGIRAKDDLGNIGAPLVVPWNFPVGYSPPLQQLDHSSGVDGRAQEITFPATTTVNAIALWTISYLQTGYCCGESFVSIYGDNNGAPGNFLAASDPITIGSNVGSAEELYVFSSTVALTPGSYWFQLNQGPNTNINGTYMFGAPNGKMYFRIEE